MKKTILLVLVLALGLAAEVANADYTFGEPTNLGQIVNTSSIDAGPSISADGLSLYFSSDRTGGYGGQDLWITTRETINDPWSEPVNLGPTVNSSASEAHPDISANDRELYFRSPRPGGFGGHDLWVTTRATVSDPWEPPVNLGSIVNTSSRDSIPNISADGLSLFFASNRPGGSGGYDLWVTTRATTEDEWGTPVNLGPTVNSSYWEEEPCISADGLALFFSSERPPGEYLSGDIWVATRPTTNDEWGEPVNLGPNVNTSYVDTAPDISADGSILYFHSDRPGGFSGRDLYQVPIIPIVDLNGDGIVDSADMCIMVDFWGTDEPLCDIGPMPWGDGIVDVQDLIVLAEHLFEGIPPVELEEVNVDEKDAGSQVELEQGRILVVTLESNPTTGYRWEQAETQESILEQMGEAEFKPSETVEPPLVGAGGWEIFRFKAISVGEMTLQLVYHRAWEEGVEPLNTFSIQVVVN